MENEDCLDKSRCELEEAIRVADWKNAARAADLILRACQARTGMELPADAAVRIIREALFSTKPHMGVPAVLAEHRELARLIEDVMAVRVFIYALANGDLSKSITIKGYLSGSLKMLQAHLKHLTWQTQMVARGDFSQRVDFLGEFAEAFNDMIRQLGEARTKLKESEERYRILAITDSLTGLATRRHFFDQACKEFRRTERHSHHVAIIMLDIDHFKTVNDTHGHASGDLVLQAVAARLRATLRETDVPGRYGGEEFIVLLPETDLAAAELVAERIRAGIAAESTVTGEIRLSVTVSLGVSARLGTGQAGEGCDHFVDEVIKQADQALYQAKHAGRNRVAVFS